MATITRMGRKPLSDEERRDKPLRIRLTDDERAKIDGAAETVGEPNTSRWARETLLRAAEDALKKRRRKRSQ